MYVQAGASTGYSSYKRGRDKENNQGYFNPPSRPPPECIVFISTSSVRKTLTIFLYYGFNYEKIQKRVVRRTK